MKTINVSISELEYNKFGLQKDKFAFSDFIEMISQELIRQSLEKCVELSEKHGLSKMTMAEITKEVKAVRHNAKNRS